MLFSTLLTVGLLTISATASPVANEQVKSAGSFRITSPSLKVALNSTGGLPALVQSDLARVKAHRSRLEFASNGASFAESDVPITSAGTVLYVEVNVGTPPTAYQLLVDTGSSNTWVGGTQKYQPTSSSKSTGNAVSVSYGSGAFEGTEFTDAVALGNMSIDAQSIGVAERSVGISPFDGILGLGPDDLTSGTVDNTDVVPTVIDNLAKQGKITSALVGLFTRPNNDSDPNGDGGSLDFGTPDSSKFNGEITYVPVTQDPSSKMFWGIDQSISYGSNNTQILESGSGIVDSGTTLLFIASDAFEAYTKATGAVQDDSTGLLKVDNPENLQSLFFNIGGNTFEFTANAQMWPRSHNVDMGGEANATYLIVASTGQPSGQGMDFVNGFAFLQRFYSVYDTANSRVGFATTAFTDATSN